MGRLRQGAGRGTVAGLGHMSMLRFVGEIIWGFRSKPGLIYSNQKEQGLLSFTEVLFKNTGEGPGRQGRLLLTRAVRKFILEVYICCGNAACHLGHALMGGASGSSRPP